MRLSDVISALTNQNPLPKNGVCVTFDDGYANNATVAAPILKARGMPATFFVTTGFLDGTTRLWVDRFETAFSSLPTTEPDHIVRAQLKRLSPDQREQQLRELETRAGTRGLIHPLHAAMTWDQARQLSQDGFEIGAHTITHPVLTTLSRDEMTHEISGSKLRIEEHGIPCHHFALPNGQPGDWDDAVLEAIHHSGFQSNLTTVDGRIKDGDDPFLLKRTTIDTGDDLLKFRLTVSGLRSTIHTLRTRLKI